MEGGGRGNWRERVKASAVTAVPLMHSFIYSICPLRGLPYQQGRSQRGHSPYQILMNLELFKTNVARGQNTKNVRVPLTDVITFVITLVY